MERILDATQWPAMAATLIAAWMVGSQSARKRHLGFGLFILSNILWVAWGWYADGYALIALQVGLFAINIRGSRKNDSKSHGSGTIIAGSSRRDSLDSRSSGKNKRPAQCLSPSSGARTTDAAEAAEAAGAAASPDIRLN